MTEEQVPLANALAAGDEGVLIAPPDPAKARFNVGIRTLTSGVTITATLRNSFGSVVKSVTRSYPPTFFNQTSAAAFVEADLQGNDTIHVRVAAGSAIVYGATTDNISQDPMMKLLRRIE